MYTIRLPLQSTRICLALLLSIFVTLAPMPSLRTAEAADQIFYVNANVVGGAQNGSSWANAFSDLQDALAAAGMDDEIWMAAGVYIPDSEGTRGASFQLKDGVAIYGGFAGGETARAQRDWTANITVLSGDLAQDDITDASGVITNTNNINGANSIHVVNGSGVTTTAVLDGVTITGGHADGSSTSGRGAGLFINIGSPTLTHVIIHGNLAQSGGGIYSNTSNSVLTDVTIIGNHAYSSYGGGIYNQNSNQTMLNVSFIGNRASNYGGGIYGAGSSPQMVNVILQGNQANRGGAMLNTGISVQGGSILSEPILTNVTISGNKANDGGGIYNFDSGRPTLQNSIIWNNQDNSGTGTAASSIFNDGLGTTTINHSLVQGQNPSGTGNLDGTNVANDPLFVVPIDSASAPTTAGDLRLQSGSPALDVGNNAADLDGGGSDPSTISIIPSDIAGNPRIVNSVIDLGAYEKVFTDLLIEKSVDAPLPAPGQAITFTLAFTNFQATTATNVIISDTLDLSLITMPEFSANLPVTATTDAPYVWEVGNLAVGGSGVILVTGVISPGLQTGLTFTNTAMILGEGDNTSVANSMSAATLTIPQQALMVNTVGEGDVTRNLTQTQYFLGQTVMLTATASVGWTFGEWGGDLSGATNPQSVTIDADKTITATFTNDPPLADAGSNQTVTTEESVTLDGGGSSDADPAQTLTYGWSQTSGPAVSLSATTAVQPTFTAPDTATTLGFSLVVTDNFGVASTPSTLTVTVVEPGTFTDVLFVPSVHGE